ncbi:MAG: bacteriohemerythrin [Patescibacteria group bacterium]|jgi:hemerythrin-like metal-binding protein
MAIINWIEEYSVGVKELDEQHQKLIAIINELFTLYSEKKFKNVDVEPIFKQLLDYADYHFSTEEHYFTLYNYEKEEAHIAMHNIYRQKIQDLKNEYDADNNEKTLFAINSFLNNWWIWHINNADKEYTAYFNANGLK